MIIATTPENRKKITEAYESLEALMTNLFIRWSDEGQYEDIKEYQKVIEKELPDGFVITKMNKRPFGFNFTIGNDAEYQIFIKMTGYGWKRLK